MPGIVVLTCAIIVIAWQAAGLIAQRGDDDFTLQADDFESFELKLDGWKVEQLEIVPTFMEVNLLKYRLRRQPEDSSLRPPRSLREISPLRNAQILIRLVHGYNMRDCMRIKGYDVQELDGVLNGYGVAVNGGGENTGESEQEATKSTENPSTNNQQPTTDLRKAQVWRLTSATSDSSLWLSGMLRAGDFTETDLSTTDMAFPRIGIPDDPSWMPRGLRLKSFRHPVRNMRYFMRAKWNNSRCDLLTFLGLRKPAWASDDALTFLVVWVGEPLEAQDEAAVSALLADVYRQVLPQLQAWKMPRTEGTEDTEGE